jgi:MFS family permease
MGLRSFALVWFGQVISLFGTGMTAFALTIWAWQKSGSATALALVGLFSFGPSILVSPFAGALVDRWNRKWVLALSDLAAVLSTLAVLTLYLTDRLEIWHLFVTGAFASVFQAFQWPAYSAAISLMVPKAQYGRASGMISLAESGSQVVAPLMAGTLLALIGVAGILVIDAITFCVAIGALMVTRIPEPTASPESRQGRGSLLKEAGYGFRYIRERPGLLWLQLLILVGNLISALTGVLVPAMLLARTMNNAGILAAVQSAEAVGGTLGGLLMSLWGGPRRRIHGVLLGHSAFSLFAQLALALGRGLPVWGAAALLGGMTIPVINGCNQAIWQSKVAPDVQGRVFSVRRLIAQVSVPAAMLIAGPMADRLFEPAVRPGGSLAPLAATLVGTGAGTGMALLFAMCGVAGIGLGLLGYGFPALREVEFRLADHQGAVKAEAVASS